MPRASVDTTGWTYGAEHELSGWDNQIPLPKGFLRSPDYTIVNSNGIAAQPNPKLYRYGGEINTPPTDTMEGQVACLRQLKLIYKNFSVNHRSNLHLHIRIPGLKDDLVLLKRIQQYIHQELPLVINLLEPIPKGSTPAEKKRAKRRKVSHHTFLTPQRLQKQLAARDVKEFFELEVPCSKAGKVMWHAQPRLAVGLRQLLQTDTIEFRHFPGTLDEEELLACFNWCKDFLCHAIQGLMLQPLWQQKYRKRRFPVFPAFDYDLEVGYQATASHNGLLQSEVKQNIQLILEGKFHGSQAEQEAKWRANGGT